MTPIDVNDPDTDCGLMWPQATHMHTEEGHCIPARDCEGWGVWDVQSGDYGAWVCPLCHCWIAGSHQKTSPKCKTRIYR